MKWGSPKDYSYLYRAALTNEYRAILLRWLEKENTALHQLVLKELGNNVVPLEEATRNRPLGGWSENP